MATVGPVPQVAGRGAIYCVYPKAIEQALLSIQFLLASGWSNPIEVWHKNELDAHQISALEKIGATVHNLSNYMVVAVKDQPKLSSGNAAQYEIKGLALLYTTLDEILFLDCDNIPIADPSVLFESDAYLETNALFWKDFWKTYPQNPIWQILDIPCTNEFEQESGQLVFKKSNPSVWRALNLAVYMQTHQELYFDLLLGDKDTFRLAWRALDIPYHMVRPHLAVLGYEYLGFFYGHSMVQYAPFWSEFDNGPAPGNHVDTESPKVMFVHANIMKHIGYSPGVSFSLLLHYKNAVTPEAHGSIVAAPTLLFKGTTTLGEYWFNGVLQETQKSNFTEMFPKFDADYQRYNEIAHQYVL